MPKRTGTAFRLETNPDSRPQNASGSKKNTSKYFSNEKVVVTVTTTFKSGGVKSPSSHTSCAFYATVIMIPPLLCSSPETN